MNHSTKILTKQSYVQNRETNKHVDSFQKKARLVALHSVPISLPVTSTRGDRFSSLDAVLVVLVFHQVIITDSVATSSARTKRSTCTATCHVLFALLVVVVSMVGAHGPRCFSLGHFDSSEWELVRSTFEPQLHFAGAYLCMDDCNRVLSHATRVDPTNSNRDL